MRLQCLSVADFLGSVRVRRSSQFSDSRRNRFIGTHPTGFCQLFLIAQGAGWAAGADGKRMHLTAGQGVFFELGEEHAKGSDTGMVAIMVQTTHLEPGGPL